MKRNSLSGKRVAILVDDGFEQTELTSPRLALEGAGAATEIVSPAPNHVRGWEFMKWTRNFLVDTPLHEADSARYDALLLPGGILSCHRLRGCPVAISFIRSFLQAGRPIAALSQSVQLLIDAGAVTRRLLTSDPVLRNDLENAGADWMDRAVVVDNGLVTCRSTDDLSSFNSAMIEEFAEAECVQNNSSNWIGSYFSERLWGINRTA